MRNTTATVILLAFLILVGVGIVGGLTWILHSLQRDTPAYPALVYAQTAGRQEVTLTSKETGGTLRAFCESGNRVYIHTRGEDADMVIVPGGVCK